MKIDALELIALWVIGQGIGGPGIVRIPQFDEYFGRGPFLGGFRPGNVDGPGIEVPGNHFPTGIDLPDFKDVTAVRAEPAALETVESRLGLGGSDRLLGDWRSRRLRPGLFPVEEKKGHGGDDTDGQQNGDAIWQIQVVWLLEPDFCRCAFPDDVFYP